MPAKYYDIHKPYKSFLKYQEWDVDGNLVSDTVTDATAFVNYHCTRITGENLKNWKQLIKMGENATTYLFGSVVTHKMKAGTIVYELRRLNGSLQARWTEYGYIMNGAFYMPSIASTACEAEAIAQSEVNFAKKYRKVSQEFGGLTFAGELIEGIRLLKSPLATLRKEVSNLHRDLSKKQREFNKKTRDYQRRMAHFASTSNGLTGSNYKAIRALERSRTRSKTRFQDAIAGTWLEWSFGIKPTIDELDGYSSALMKIIAAKSYDVVMVKGSGNAEKLTEAATLTRSSMFNVPWSTYMDYSNIKYSQVVTRGVLHVENPSGEMPPFQTMGVSFLDVVPTAWELIPWSFLADYFINIGSTIDAWQMRFVNWRWLNRSVRNVTQLKCQGAYHPVQVAGSGLTGHSRGGLAVITRKDVTRDTILAIEHFNHRPYFRLPINASQGYNISALVAMRIKPK